MKKALAIFGVIAGLLLTSLLREMVYSQTFPPAGGGGGGGVTSIFGSTGTVSSLTVPTGGSIGTSGTGTVAATSVSGLSVASGKTLTASNTLTFTGTDSSSVAFGSGGTVAYSGGAHSFNAYGLWQLTPPVFANYSWFNQGGATASHGTNFISVLSPAQSSYSLHGLNIACNAGTAWTDWYAYLMASGGAGITLFGGLEIDDGTKYVVEIIGTGGSIQTATYSTSSGGSVNSLNSDTIQPITGPIWMHVSNASGSLTFQYSTDGVGWRTLTAGTSGSLSSVTNCGFVANSQSSSNTVSVTVLSSSFSALTAQ
ncbi:MAG: hypothetical protein KGL39_33125 [Patescibacteria group bacterium]|nr:hypothetical protein [Patescibacteria group bacterium]